MAKTQKNKATSGHLGLLKVREQILRIPIQVCAQIVGAPTFEILFKGDAASRAHCSASAAYETELHTIRN